MSKQGTLTSQQVAFNVATMLMQSFPETSSLPHQMQVVLLKQCQTILIDMNVDIETADKLISPTVGLPATTNELTAYNLRRWLEKQNTPQKPREAPRLTEEDDWVPPTPEEKERSKRLVSAFKAAAIMCKPPKDIPYKPIQSHNPEALLRASDRRVK